MKKIFFVNALEFCIVIAALVANFSVLPVGAVIALILLAFATVWLGVKMYRFDKSTSWKSAFNYVALAGVFSFLVLGITGLCVENTKLDGYAYAALGRQLKARIKQLGEVNVGAIAEYETVSERYEFLTGQRADILEASDSLKQIIDDMDKTIKTKFKESFDQIVVQFEEIFSQLFGGGHAELRLDDENNPLESGIEIIAQPPGKKLQNINLLSGGEKTMTAIALMFAVLKTKPTPFCILDEVEAALDDANIERFAKYLKTFEDIQFTLVTHQKATMEHADVLYGVTMPEQGVSKVLSLNMGDSFEI